LKLFQAVIFGTKASRFQDPKLFETSSNVLVQPEVQLKTLPPFQRKLWEEAEVALAAKNFKVIPG
jgi:hypothetical protein